MCQKKSDKKILNAHKAFGLYQVPRYSQKISSAKMF